MLQSSRIVAQEKRTIKKLKKTPHVQLKFDLNPKEYAREISNAKALVEPSMYEGFATPILEALYYKTPAIISDIPVYHEIFSKEHVYYFKCQDSQELAKLIDSPNLKIKPFTKNFKAKYNFVNCVNQIISSFSSKRSNNRLQRNFVFNVIYQMLVVLTPLILTPYVSRVLGAASVGQFSFAYTISFYFVIIGSLGFQQYAQRAIAEVQNDKEEQSKVFWQLFIVRLLPVTISLSLLFIMYACGAFGEYSPLVLFLSILVAGTAFDINYYFHGKENFLSVMVVNLIIRLVFLISIFLFVKTRNDLGLYTLLYSLMVFGSYLSMWLALPMNLRKVKLTTLNFKKHMRFALSLFLPVAAVSIYAILDKTLIGALMHGQTYQKIGYITIIVNISDLENGYYYETERLIKALLSIILAVGTVMSTRNSIEYSNKHKGTIKKNIYHSFRYVFCLGIPLAFGAMIVSNPFVPLFYGDGYEKTATLIMIYAPVILIVGCSNILGLQYLLPTKRDKEYSISVLIGFALNIAFNCMLIPFLGAIGAVVGTLISEFFIAFTQYYFVRKDFSLKIIGAIIWKYVIAGLLMLLGCFLFYFLILTNTRTDNFVRIIVLVPLGAAIYYIALLLLRDKFVFEYTKVLITTVKKGIIYAKQRVLNQSKTALALLSINSKSRQVKEKEIPVIIKENHEK